MVVVSPGVAAPIGGVVSSAAVVTYASEPPQQLISWMGQLVPCRPSLHYTPSLFLSYYIIHRAPDPFPARLCHTLSRLPSNKVSLKSTRVRDMRTTTAPAVPAVVIVVVVVDDGLPGRSIVVVVIVVVDCTRGAQAQ